MWKDLLRRIEAVTGPSVWPVPAGLAVGAGLLGVVVLSQPPASVSDRAPVQQAAKVSTPTQPIASRTISLAPKAPDPGRATPARPAASRTFLLPPRPDASDVTRRIEAGLPPREEPKAKPPEALKPPKVSPAKVEKQGSQRPKIAIVIDDMGFDRDNSARAVRLPPQVTLAYLPFAPAVRAQVRHARLKGHPVMLHLPMEAPDHKGKPGYNVLGVTTNEASLRKQLSRMLGRFGGYTGVNNHMGSRFTRDRARMDIVVSELKKRGLYFLDSRTSGRSVGARAAADAGIPHAVRDVFLDHDPEAAKIRERLVETETLARRTGRAIAIGHPRTATMDLLAPWIAGLKARGFDLVRLDSLLTRPQRKKLARVETAE